MKKYLVIGNPIQHSLSPKLHNHWIRENNIDAVYDRKELNKNDIKGIIDDVKNGKIVSKPKTRKEALNILESLNGQKHQLISSICISKNGSMVWNFSEAATLTMKQLNLDEIKSYLKKIRDKELYAYGVYQIEADGRSLFSKIEGDENTIMGLPVKQIKEYLNKQE